MPPDCALELIELPGVKRAKNYPIAKIMAEEGEQLLKAIPKNCHIVALDEHGAMWDTIQLADHLMQWRQQGQNLALLIGGADGLAATCKQAARHLWSLSRLTLPHGLVRIVIAEQFYRAWSVLNCHPYHRV